jgi:Mor family transcriptional regulator
MEFQIMSIADKIAELLQGDIQSAIEDCLCVEPGSAKVIAGVIFNRLQTSWGGKELYIPVRDTVSRNQAIRTQFNGRNHAAVCKQHGISLSHLYRIIK